jgi:zinc transport system substrate-binding protein
MRAAKVTALLTSCVLSLGPGAPAAQPATPGPLIIASFYPLWEFTREVARDRMEVATLVPNGVEPHDWEPAPHDVARLEKARAFVYNGAGLEPWVDKLIRNLGGKGPLMVRTTERVTLLDAQRAHAHDRPGGEKRSPAPGHRHEKDPHVWLDPVLAQAQVEAIRIALSKIDPAQAERYASHARAFTARLTGLHEAYTRGLAQCARRDIIVSHAAFTYLARRYGLTQVPIMGLAPDAEPSAADLAAVARFAKQRKVRFIFFETLVSQKLADTLAREVGARTLVLNPIEGLTREEAAAGKGYVDLMEENLRNLRVALECR